MKNAIDFLDRHFTSSPWVFAAFIAGACVPDRFVNEYTAIGAAAFAAALGFIGLIGRWHSEGDA